MTNVVTLGLLMIAFLIIIALVYIIYKSSNKNQLKKVFSLNLLNLLICILGQMLQLAFASKYNIKPIYFDYFVYIGTCFLPVSVYFTGKVFADTKIKFKKSYLLLFIIPIVSLLVLWTNDFHHLFYQSYSTYLADTIYGPYMTIHNIYSYLLLFIGIIYLLKFSIKNVGFFSKQSLLIVLGMSIPVIINILGTLKIIPMTIYITPITFTFTILFCAISIFKFQFLGATPIALQKIVDRISDSYLVLDDSNCVTDFNKTFLTTFKINNTEIRGKNLEEFFKSKKYDIDFKTLRDALEKVRNTSKTISLQKSMNKINKVFTIEINTISSKGAFLGTLILFKDITQHIEDMRQIKDTQESLMESERLSSLGQLIGGIAHNLKTPIMSISGAAEGLTDLINEYDSSIDDPTVNSQDHHDIAKDMSKWIVKIKEYTEYMSDVITAVKGQAVVMSSEDDVNFTITELVKRVTILMKHELKNAIIALNTKVLVDENLTIHGDVNNLVQVINNMISNAIQAYNGKENENIDFTITQSNNNVIFSIEDYAGGLPDKVQDKLFKEMITTKGKNGTGLGLYMSYSTIKAHFNGNITFETEKGKGTKFSIYLPI